MSPELCLLRFVVYDVDMFGEPNFIGHYTIPVKCALDGVRSVPLRNTFSEELELAGQFTQSLRNVQGDTSVCDEPPVDFKTKVLFWPGLSWPGQNGTFVLKSTGGSSQPDHDVSPCTDIR